MSLLVLLVCGLATFSGSNLNNVRIGGVGTLGRRASSGTQSALARQSAAICLEVLPSPIPAVGYLTGSRFGSCMVRYATVQDCAGLTCTRFHGSPAGRGARPWPAQQDDFPGQTFVPGLFPHEQASASACVSKLRASRGLKQKRKRYTEYDRPPLRLLGAPMWLPRLLRNAPCREDTCQQKAIPFKGHLELGAEVGVVPP